MVKVGQVFPPGQRLGRGTSVQRITGCFLPGPAIFRSGAVQCSLSVRDLLPTEWAVLGLLSCTPQHGFALARSLSPDGDFGHIWTVRRPLVYRALDTLRADGLIEFQGTEPSDAGPPQRKTAITPEGRRLVLEWLPKPVEHVRDARSLLLLKLAIIEELGLDPAPLIESQLARVRDMQAGLKVQLAQSWGGSEHMVFLYRLETTKALERFLVQRAGIGNRARRGTRAGGPTHRVART